MVYGTKDQFDCSLEIGGKEYPATSTNINELFWYESIHQSLPSLNLTFKDYTGEYAQIVAAGDGVKINIELGDGRGGKTGAVFNIQGPPQVMPGNGTYLVKVNAVLDNIEYNRKIPSGLYEGTSQSVISKLATEAGLTSESPGSTSDSQVWLPNNKTIVNFIHSIAAHAYAGDASAMIFGVTDQKKHVYGDANELIKQDSGIVLGYDESQGHIIMQDWNGTSSGMIANNFKSYGATTAFWSAEGLLQEFNKIQATLFGSSLFSFSNDNANRVGDLGTRIDAQPRPSGNTHDKYNEAAHINSRTKAMWNIDLNCVVYQWTGLELLKSAQCFPPKHGQPGVDEMFSGTLLLTAKTKALYNSKYVERMTLTTNGA